MKRITRKLFIWFNPESGSIDIDSIAKTRKESNEKASSDVLSEESNKELLDDLKNSGWICEKITVHFDLQEKRKKK